MDPVLHGYVTEFRNREQLDEQLTLEDAFEVFATFCAVSNVHEDRFNAASLRTGAPHGDGGIDGFAVLINGEIISEPEKVASGISLGSAPRVQVVVVQAKTSTNWEADEIRKIAHAIERLFKAETPWYGATPGIKNAKQLIDAIYENEKKIAGHLPELHIWYVTAGRPLPGRLKKPREDAVAKLADLSGCFKSVKFHAVGAAELKGHYEKATAALSVTLTVPEKQRGELAGKDRPGKVVFGLVSALEFVQNVLWDEPATGSGTGSAHSLRTVLFDENVRDFQGYQHPESVNDQIRTTLNDPKQRLMFPMLNNGITIVAQSIEYVGKDKIVITDPRIVNGCQTSNVLFDVHSANPIPKEVMVPVRVFELSQSDDNDDSGAQDDAAEKVMIASNRQTSFPVGDLEVRTEHHRNIERYFAQRDPRRRLYYERRLGQYTRRNRAIVSTLVVNRLELASAFAAVYLGRNGRLLRSELTKQLNDMIFGAENSLVSYYVAASIHYWTDWLLRNRSDKYGEYRPARFVMMRAVALRLMGPEQYSPTERVERVELASILDPLWAPGSDGRPGGNAESEFGRIVPALVGAVERAKALDQDLSEP